MANENWFNEKYPIEICTNNNIIIKWNCKNWKPDTPITIWEKIKELKKSNSNNIFVSFYNPNTKNSTNFTALNEINDNEIKNIEKFFKIKELVNKEIKGALIIENNEGTYYDITINKPY